MSFRVALVAVAALSLVRLIVAFAIPLSGDEAYYWTWSRHLEFGYTDHPPAVAWLIALGSVFGHDPGFVRVGFVAAEAGAALALGGAAWRLARDERAGTIAALAFCCVPQQKLAIGEALPDGPYVLFWALGLLAASAILTAPQLATWRSGTFLGLALGGALLSRAFGWALVFGIFGVLALPASRGALRRGVWIAVPVMLLVYAPFVVWNATHGWATLAFTLRDRQPFDTGALVHHGLLSTLRFALYAVPLIYVALRLSRGRSPQPLVGATATPLLAALLAIAPVYPIESYWIMGPVASICVGTGIALSRAGRPVRRAWGAAGALALTATVLPVIFLALPEPAQAAFFAGPGKALAGTLGSGAFAYAPLAAELRTMTAQTGRVILVDRPEIGSELAFEGVDSVAVGFSPDVVEMRRYHDTPRGTGDALFVRYAPVSEDPTLVASLRPLCRRLDPGPVLEFRHGGIRSERFFTSWCRGGETASDFGR